MTISYTGESGACLDYGGYATSIIHIVCSAFVVCDGHLIIHTLTSTIPCPCHSFIWIYRVKQNGPETFAPTTVPPSLPPTYEQIGAGVVCRPSFEPAAPASAPVSDSGGCYRSCQAAVGSATSAFYFSLAPTGPGGAWQCTCNLTCATQEEAPGAQAFVSCATSSVTVVGKSTHKQAYPGNTVKYRVALVQKPTLATATKGAALRSRGPMVLQILLPPGLILRGWKTAPRLVAGVAPPTTANTTGAVGWGSVTKSSKWAPEARPLVNGTSITGISLLWPSIMVPAKHTQKVILFTRLHKATPPVQGPLVLAACANQPGPFGMEHCINWATNTTVQVKNKLGWRGGK